jgi:hypothetical protein
MRALLAGHLYDDLPAGEKERVEAHLAACADCRQALASMREAASALDAWTLSPARAPAASFDSGLQASAQDRPAAGERPTRRRYTSRRFPLLSWAAAAALFLLAVTLHLVTRSPAEKKEPAAAAPPPSVAQPGAEELEKARREAEEEIARIEEDRRRARERLDQVERDWEKLVAEKKKEAEEEAHRQALARIEAERKKAEADLGRAREARREAEVRLVRAETKGTLAVVAQLDWVQGEVFVLTSSGRVPARTSKALVSGQGLETLGAESLAVVTFPDQTRLEVGSATTVREMSDGEKGKLIGLARGTLRATVARQPADRPLVLRTADAEARVLGTRLRLVSQDSTRLEVQEGRVRLSRSKDGAILEVTAGNYAVTNVARMLPRPIREVSFQDGVSPVPAYAGTRDTFLSELNAAHPYGGRPTIQADGDNPGGTGKELRLLIRWDLAAIPAGSRVQTAAIILRVVSPSEPPYWVHAVKRPWTEGESTWRTSSGDRGPAVLGSGIPSGPDEFAFPLNAEGIALVQSWIDSPGSNLGLMVTATGNSSGLQAHSRESSETGKRPRFVVTYTPR